MLPTSSAAPAAALLFDGSLPIHALQQDIQRAIAAHQTLIICGETGSGKTTQIPKFCLALGRGQEKLIGCTQPRRIAARSVAQRLAQELDTPLGQKVGYQVRFHDQISEHTQIKVMTDGILLAEIHHDPLLRRYDTLIIDEAHERSLNIDFLLGYLRRILGQRPDLRLIITSATLESERFSRHFNQAPVIEVSGRSYPVEIRWRPLQAPSRDMLQSNAQDPQQALLEAVDELTQQRHAGDILVFLPGEREIREAAESLRKHHPPHTEILALFARQSFAQQERVFKPEGGRRIVLATNVAETSLTVPGIRYVVDTGLARVSRYSVRHKVTQLQIEKISRAAAQQRAGRCGRVASGICIRLYDEQDFAARSAYTTPEILRTSLAAVILKMSALGLGEVEQFPFLDPPSPRAIDDGYQLLHELGALDGQRHLTTLGHELARLPVDPRVGRMLLAAREQDCLQEMLIITAALSSQDPRERPAEQRALADQQHARFQHEHSEFLPWLALWHQVQEAMTHKKSGRKFAHWCQEQFLSWYRLREWRDTHAQLRSLVSQMGFRLNTEPSPPDSIHRALLTGLLGHVGWRSPEGEDYQGPRGIRFWINPGSTRFKRKAQWVMAAELTETTRLYARTLARIDPAWIESCATHLLRRSYFDPFWDEKSAQANIYEKVTLYGLPIVAKRRVRLGPVDAAAARRLFIRHALVLGEYRTQAPFWIHNQRLVQEIETLEHKGRRQDVLVDEDTLIGFYDALLPPDIWSGERFEKWRRHTEKEQPKHLFMQRARLMRHAAAHLNTTLYPDTYQLHEHTLRLRYRFEPGHVLDGVTLEFPLELLGQLQGSVLDWLVPGMIRDKITLLLKGLAQRIRRELVPLPQFITQFLEQAPNPATHTLTQALTRFIEARTGLRVEPEDWILPPPHLRFNLRILDETGQELDCGRDLWALQQRWGAQARNLLQQTATQTLTRSGLTGWDLEDLPESLTITRRGLVLQVYPTLVDEGQSVALQLSDDPHVAREQSLQGLRRLLHLELQATLRACTRTLPDLTTNTLRYAALLQRLEEKSPARAMNEAPSAQERFKHALTERALQELVSSDTPPVRRRSEFEILAQQVRPALAAKILELNQTVTPLLQTWQELMAQLRQSSAPSQASARDNMLQQMRHLMPVDFIQRTPLSQLKHFARYLRAIHLRLEKLPRDLAGDLDKQRQLAALESPWLQRCAQGMNPHLEAFGWMLEELRVSLFAQILKTPYPISVKRLEKEWTRIRQLPLTEPIQSKLPPTAL